MQQLLVRLDSRIARMHHVPLHSGRPDVGRGVSKHDACLGTRRKKFGDENRKGGLSNGKHDPDSSEGPRRVGSFDLVEDLLPEPARPLDACMPRKHAPQEPIGKHNAQSAIPLGQPHGEDPHTLSLLARRTGSHGCGLRETSVGQVLVDEGQVRKVQPDGFRRGELVDGEAVV